VPSAASSILPFWQERRGYERAATPGNIYRWQRSEKHMCIYFTVEIHYAFVYGFTVLPGLVLLRGTCPRLACNSIGGTRTSIPPDIERNPDTFRDLQHAS